VVFVQVKPRSLCTLKLDARRRGLGGPPERLRIAEIVR
jgi:hypothetical protein